MGERQGRGPKKFLGLGKPESHNAAPGRRSRGGRRRRRARLPEFDALNGPLGSGRTRENQRLRRCRGARIGDGAADGRLRRVGPCLAGRSRKHQYRSARVAGRWVDSDGWRSALRSPPPFIVSGPGCNSRTPMNSQAKDRDALAAATRSDVNGLKRLPERQLLQQNSPFPLRTSK